jgi:glycosyltransferase involved in cell wall biosynthesis
MKRQLRVGIDAHYLGAGVGGGETYTLNLLRGLACLDQRNAYTVFLTSGQDRLPDLTKNGNFTLCRLWPDLSWIRLPLSLPTAALGRSVDLLHVHFAAPPICPVPFVATIYDLSFKRHPDCFPRFHPYRVTRIIASTARRAAKIITISESAKADLMEVYQVPGERIAVTPLGVDMRFHPAPDPKLPLLVLDRYRIRPPFVLYVGNLQPRKNVTALIRAFSALKLRAGIPHRLVIAGRENWLYQDIYDAYERSPAREDIQFTGYVPDQDLVAFYQAAEVFVYPSLYEGFGLPLLEAMACGTPVIAAQTSSLPEVVGDAGFLVNPHDTEELAEVMRRVLLDPALRRQMRDQGLQRAAQYSWRRTAEATLAVYEEVGARLTAAGRRR